MPTKQDQPAVAREYELTELAELLIKTNGIHEGLYSVGFKFAVTIGSIETKADETYPGVTTVVQKAGLFEVEKMGPNVVDAAKVNPLKKPRKTKAP